MNGPPAIKTNGTPEAKSSQSSDDTKSAKGPYAADSVSEGKEPRGPRGQRGEATLLTSSTDIFGSCVCGAVTVTLKGGYKDAKGILCYCKSCKKRGGGRTSSLSSGPSHVSDRCCSKSPRLWSPFRTQMSWCVARRPCTSRQRAGPARGASVISAAPAVATSSAPLARAQVSSSSRPPCSTSRRRYSWTCSWRMHMVSRKVVRGMTVN